MALAAWLAPAACSVAAEWVCVEVGAGDVPEAALVSGPACLEVQS